MTESVFAYSKKIDSPESFVVVVVVVLSPETLALLCLFELSRSQKDKLSNIL